MNSLSRSVFWETLVLLDIPRHPDSVAPGTQNSEFFILFLEFEDPLAEKDLRSFDFKETSLILLSHRFLKFIDSRIP